jgi:hypothetical protein
MLLTLVAHSGGKDPSTVFLCHHDVAEHARITYMYARSSIAIQKGYWRC